MIGAFLNRWNEGAFSFDEKNREFVFDKNKKAKLWEGSRPYMGLSLLDCAKECLTAKGIRWQSKNQSEIVSLAFQSTSDFPYILADSANKTLRAGYDMAPSPWKMISAQRSAKDFKSQYELTLDSSVRLGKVPESGEYVRGYLTEGRESWKIAPYGQIIAVTRTASSDLERSPASRSCWSGSGRERSRYHDQSHHGQWPADGQRFGHYWAWTAARRSASTRCPPRS